MLLHAMYAGDQSAQSTLSCEAAEAAGKMDVTPARIAFPRRRVKIDWLSR